MHEEMLLSPWQKLGKSPITRVERSSQLRGLIAVIFLLAKLDYLSRQSMSSETTFSPWRPRIKIPLKTSLATSFIQYVLSGINRCTAISDNFFVSMPKQPFEIRSKQYCFTVTTMRGSIY